MRLNTTFEHLTGGWEIGRCLISHVYCNMCVWCACMCTCMHICLCLYSFVCVLSSVKQQMLKNSECFCSRISQSNCLPSWSPFCSQALIPHTATPDDCIPGALVTPVLPSSSAIFFLLSTHPCANYRAAQRWRPMGLTARRSSYQTSFAKDDQAFPISIFQQSVNVGLTILVQAWSIDGYKNPRSNLHIFLDSQTIILVAVVKR